MRGFQPFLPLLSSVSAAAPTSATIVGRPTPLALGTSATPGAQALNVLPEAEGVIVWWGAWPNSLASISGDFCDALTITQLNSTGNFASTGVAYARVTSTGSKTITPVWNTTGGDGPNFFVAFVKNIPTSGAWVRDPYIERSDVASGVTLTGTVDSSTTDLVVAFDGQYLNSVPALESGWTSLQTQSNNNYNARLSNADTPGAVTTSFSGNGTDYPMLAMISVMSRSLGVSATLSQTLGALTLSAAAGAPVTARTSQTLGALTLSAAASAPVTASLSQTLGAVTFAATGTTAAPEVSASLTQTLLPLTLSAAASAPVLANVSATLGALTLASVGSAPAGGTVSRTLALLSLSSTASAPVGATLTKTLAALSLSSAASSPVSAALSQTLGTLTLSATGSAAPLGVVAALDQTLAPVTLSATAQLGRVAALAQTLAPVTLDAAALLSRSAALSQILAPLTLSSTAAATVGAALAQTFEPLTLVSVASVTTTSPGRLRPGVRAVGAVAAGVEARTALDPGARKVSGSLVPGAELQASIAAGARKISSTLSPGVLPYE